MKRYGYYKASREIENGFTLVLTKCKVNEADGGSHTRWNVWVEDEEGEATLLFKNTSAALAKKYYEEFI